MLCNKHKNVLYIGMTDDLGRRLYEHKNRSFRNSFTDRYNVEYLVYYECFDEIGDAVKREEELKKWSRKKKENLINKKNAEWRDLSYEFE